MANFKLYLLTPDMESKSYFVDLITSYDGQLTHYQNKQDRTGFLWDVEKYSEQDNNFSFNEKFSVHKNAQKELTFDMAEKHMINNNWINNIFVSRLHIGSMLLLKDKSDNDHLFVVKNIKTQISEVNSTYSYTCQDAFSYTLTRQNDGYSIVNDPTTDDFIGAKTIDWWAEKIVADCYIAETYIKTNEILYKNTSNQIITVIDSNNLTNVVSIIKEKNVALLEEGLQREMINKTFSFSCDSSNALNALISLGDLIDHSINVCEHAVLKGSRATIYRYFWFEPNKLENMSPYFYSPKKNIESFSLDQAGDSLTSILNVKSHSIGDETITLLPQATPRFLQWFKSVDWENSEYSDGFFTNLLDGKILTSEGVNPSIVKPQLSTALPKPTTNDLKNLILQPFWYNHEVYIPIISNDANKNGLQLGWWDTRFKFSTESLKTYFYISETSQTIYSSSSFPCTLKMKLASDTTSDTFIEIKENEEIPSSLRGEKVIAYLTFKDIWTTSTNTKPSISFFLSPELNIYFYSDVSEEDRQFAKIADKIPWLENKIVDFSYFVNKGVLTEREYELLMKEIFDKLRIINGQLLCYSQEYYKALQSKVELIANLESTVENLHAELEAVGITPYAEKSVAKDINKFVEKYQSAMQLYRVNQTVPGAREIQNNYFNKYFQANQRFLKNIYKFREYFNSPISSVDKEVHSFTCSLTPQTDKYILFSSTGFTSCKNLENNVLTDQIDYYIATNSNEYQLVEYVNKHNVQKYYEKAKEQITLTAASSANSKNYNSDNKYFWKYLDSEKDFYSEFLNNVSPTYTSGGINYYLLSKDQLKAYYYYKLRAATDKGGLYIKGPVGYEALSSDSMSGFNLTTVYFSNDNTKPITFSSPGQEGFVGWTLISGANISSPYEGVTPAQFILNSGICEDFTTQTWSDSAKYYTSPSACFEATIAQGNDTATYDNHYKYRVATNYQIDGNTLYVPKTYYKQISSSDLTNKKGLYFLISSNEKTIEVGNDIIIKAYSFNGVKIPLNNQSIKGVDYYKVYQYIDYSETTLDTNNWKDFCKNIVYQSDEVFDPLQDSLGAGKDLLDICSTLYLSTTENLDPIQATEYSSNKVYLKKNEDNSYTTMLTYDKILANKGSYYISNSLGVNFLEWGSLSLQKPKKFNFTLYLYNKTSQGVTIKQHLDLYEINVTPERVDGEVKINLSNSPIVIKDGQDEYRSLLTITSLKEDTITSNTNGEFWWNYIDSSDDPFYQEKALMIEEQLTQYWQQAHTASKYCNWFIPEKWTQKADLTKNQFFNNLFLVNGSSIKIYDFFIPEVSIVSKEGNSKLPNYQITYDPFSIDSAGQYASALESTNQAFQDFSNELLGANSMSKFKLEPLGTTTSYYYVKQGGCSWRSLIEQLGASNTTLEKFSGLYGLLFYLTLSLNENNLSSYSRLQQQKESLWKNLHKFYPHVFYEGYFEYPEATTSEELYQMAEYAFKGKSEPETNYSVSILDIYSLKGYSGESLRVGQPILIDATEYQMDNVELKKAIDQYLFITDISYSLRSDTNISITVNRIKYDEKLIQKLVKLIR